MVVGDGGKTGIAADYYYVWGSILGDGKVLELNNGNGSPA